jgi:hypothetical protein
LQGVAVLLYGLEAHRFGLLFDVLQGVAVLLYGLEAIIFIKPFFGLGLIDMC